MALNNHRRSVVARWGLLAGNRKFFAEREPLLEAKGIGVGIELGDHTNTTEIAGVWDDRT